MEKEVSAVVCPYDKNHVIDKSRIQRHLIKCSKNFPPKYRETCPFNATHRMCLSDLQKHIEECPDRKYLEPERYSFLLKNHGSIKSCPPSVSESAIGDDHEKWELCSRYSDFNSVISENNFELPPPPSSTSYNTRRPLGYSEVMMINIPEEDKGEDTESVISSVGRGKVISKNLEKPKNGRGKGIISRDDIRVGASALTDADDTESVASSISRIGIGRGIIHRRIMNDLKYDTDTDDTKSVVSSIISEQI